MPESVFTMLEFDATGGGFVIGVFADRTHAVEIAKFWAVRQSARWHENHIKTFKLDADTASPYRCVVESRSDSTDVMVLCTATGDHELRRWHVQRHDVIARESREPEQIELFSAPAYGESA